MATPATEHTTTPTDLTAFDKQVQAWRDDLKLAQALAKVSGAEGARARASIPMIRMNLDQAQAVYDANPWQRWVYQYVGNIVHRAGCARASKHHALPQWSGTDDADTVAGALPGARSCPECCPDAEDTALTARAQSREPRPDYTRTPEEFGYVPSGPRHNPRGWSRRAHKNLDSLRTRVR